MANRLHALPMAAAMLAAVCMAALSGYAAPARGADTMPLFDAHVHYNQPAWRVFDPPYVEKVLDRAGVTGALVGSTPDDGTLTLFKANPARFIPELRPYRGEVNAGNWTRDPGVVGYISERLSKAPYAGIGEIHIYKVSEVDWEVIGQVAAIARKNKIFLHVHSEAPAIERIFALEPNVTILWAHAGFYDTPETIGRMLDKYDRLHAELSLRAPNILPPGDKIAPGWKAVLLRHQDRFVVGSDTYINLAWAEYDEIIADHRAWLAKLPRDVAEKIAQANAEKLLGKSSRD